jgi:uncharacterized membrane protein
MKQTDDKKPIKPKRSQRLVLPILSSAAYLMLCYIRNYGLFLFSLAYFLTPLGRFVIYPFTAAGAQSTLSIFGKSVNVSAFILSPWEMILAMTAVDVFFSWFVIWNLDYAKLMPAIGGLFIRCENTGKKALRNHGWIKSLAYTGIFIVVLSPVYGTNAVMGSVIAKICGFDSRITFVCVALGAFMGSVLISLPVLGLNLLF